MDEVAHFFSFYFDVEAVIEYLSGYYKVECVHVTWVVFSMVWILLLVCSCLQIFGITVAVKIVYIYECRCNTSYTPSCNLYLSL